MRKLATENGIDLGSIKGTGVGGRIRKQDVLDAAEAAKAAAEAPAAAAGSRSAPAASGSGVIEQPASSDTSLRGTTQKMTRLRKVIAKRMVESLQISAQLTTVVEVDVTKIARLRDRAKGDFERREGTKLSFLPFFALAAVEALKAHPTVNCQHRRRQGHLPRQREPRHRGRHREGPAGPGHQERRRPQHRRPLAQASPSWPSAPAPTRSRPTSSAGGTFTLTNTGQRGALFDTPIINQPQVAILGTGAVVKRPVVVKDGDGGETIAIRSMVYLALSYDHRIVDGADAARFLTTVKDAPRGRRLRGRPGSLRTLDHACHSASPSPARPD